MKDKCTKCGEIILADTEDWVDPLCHKHYCDFLGRYQAQLADANAVIDFYAEDVDWNYCTHHCDTDSGKRAREYKEKYKD